MTPVQRRYMREFWPPMAAYMLIMLLAWPLVGRVQDAWLRVALALLPVLPVLFVTRAIVRFVLGSDELEQRLHLIGLAIAGTVVGTLCLAGGFLVAAKVIRLDGTVLIWVWPAMVVLHALGRSWAGHRYGGGWACGSDGLARHWQLWIVSASLGFIALAGWSQFGDWQRGVLCGISGVLAGWALVLTIRWHRKPERRA
ncbi:hypothetical protein ASG87_16725 [Frateuria sp. Soil773]|uniref:hypothetical protein n=1 Tax=Frateuria sp. Soil773 TaxID=1736407 RepID=UPI0006FD79B3|nr:hypothetical protein [Frateuria sp. Soil773]KRE96627.1 hypothetical protein ASG87_16725 [Frateuria sp. Soil773]